MKNDQQVKTTSNQKINTPIKYYKNVTTVNNDQSANTTHTTKKIIVSEECSNYFSPQKICYRMKGSAENLTSAKQKNRIPHNMGYIYESPEYEDGNFYGEKVNEKKNYVLYCSQLPLETKDKQFNNIIENIDTTSPIKFATRSNFYEKENISNENYNYKEIKAFKDSCPEIKSVIQHQVFNTPLALDNKRVSKVSNTKKNLDINININNGKKLYGSLPKTKMNPPLSTTGKFKKNRQFVFEKKRAINQKMNYNKDILSEQSDYSKIFIRKLPHVMSENNLGNSTSNVKTYTKSTKDCDYIIKVTTTFTEIPNNDPGIKVQTTKKTSQIFNSSEKYQKNCTKNFGSVERITNNNKYIITKNGAERKRIACCPIHGKKKFIYKNVL